MITPETATCAPFRISAPPSSKSGNLPLLPSHHCPPHVPHDGETVAVHVEPRVLVNQLRRQFNWTLPGIRTTTLSSFHGPCCKSWRSRPPSSRRLGRAATSKKGCRTVLTSVANAHFDQVSHEACLDGEFGSYLSPAVPQKRTCMGCQDSPCSINRNELLSVPLQTIA